jgi:hypothetical protein
MANADQDARTFKVEKEFARTMGFLALTIAIIFAIVVLFALNIQTVEKLRATVGIMALLSFFSGWFFWTSK